MAVTTRNQRFSLISWMRPFSPTLPNPPKDNTAAERKQIQYLYYIMPMGVSWRLDEDDFYVPGAVELDCWVAGPEEIDFFVPGAKELDATT